MTFRTILFDFFGTLVGYSASRTAQGYTRTDALLRAGGLTGTYEGWLAQWGATFAEFEEHSRRDWSEFSMTDVATAFLNQVGPSSDDDVVLSIEVGHRKPHPVIYQAALERLGADPTQTLFVGDTLDADYEGPRRAGIDAMLITDADGLVPTTDRLASVLELPDALDGHHIT